MSNEHWITLRAMSALGAIGEGLAELAIDADGRDVALGAGGDVANICVMAARLGTEARLAGRVGDDALGVRLLRYWSGQGVGVSAIRRDPAAPTGVYINESTQGLGHRFTYWRRGSAGSRVEAGDLQATFFDALGTLVVSGITLAVSRSATAAARHAIAQARDAGARVCCVLNHRAALGGDIDELAQVAAGSDILIASSEDAEAVFGGSSEHRALGALGPSEIVISDGPHAVWAMADGEELVQAVPEVVVRNAAGAGDALAGAYLAARLQGQSPAGGLTWAVAASSLSVQREGCAGSYPTMAETMTAVGELASVRSAG
jgi:2-dehydro-3-deoxygluconokinase